MRILAFITAAFLAIGTTTASATLLTVKSYDMNNGCGHDCGGTFNYWDGNYNGSGATTVSNSYLSGGTGALTDGVISNQLWFNVSNNSGTGPYVGWETTYHGNPLITFHLAGTPTVKSVELYVDNSDIGGVGAPSSLTIDGVNHVPTVTPTGTYTEELTVGGLSLSGSTITVTPNAGTEPWIFVSEVQFNGLASSVPEPSTWVLLVVGFAGLGFAGYRKANTAKTVLDAA